MDAASSRANILKIWMRLATRFLWSRRKGGLLSLLSIVSLVGITLGVMVPVIAISILNGFQDHIKVRLAALEGEIVIKALPSFGKLSNLWIDSPQTLVQLLERQPEVRHAYACTSTEGIFVYKSSWSPVSIHGVPKEFLQRDPSMLRYYQMIDGSADIQGVQRVNIGLELSDSLKIRNESRARLLVLSTNSLSPLSVVPTEIPIKVTGIFKTGLLDYDQKILYTSTETLQRFLQHSNQITEIRIRLDQQVDIKSATASLQHLLLDAPQHLGVFSWQEFHKNLLLSLEVESLGIWIVMFFILLVAVFNIVGSQTLLITEKKREIGILKTIGVTPQEIRTIFLAEGLLVTSIGSILGGTLGCLICQYINEIISGIESGMNAVCNIFTAASVDKVPMIRLIPEGVYYLEGIPVSFHIETVVIIVSFALIFTVFASIIPSHKAAHASVVSSIQSQE